MAMRRKRILKEKCCDFSIDIPVPIQNELIRKGGFKGLLSQIPESAELLRNSRLHQALADPIRLTVMYALLSQPLCVCVIKEVIKIADSKLSYHLNILKEQELIYGEQQGNWIIYRITDRGRQALENTQSMSN
jgi:ArsR family transcriptional regulator, arsenate/arsenite/antimonite-responsive transcriptional repressor